MSQETIIKLLTGANKIARESSEMIKESSSQYIEEKVLKGNYVSRLEYQQLEKLVLKLQEEIKELKSKH